MMKNKFLSFGMMEQSSGTIQMTGDPAGMKEMDLLFWRQEREWLFDLVVPFIRQAALMAARSSVDDLSLIGVGIDWNLVNSAALDFAESYSFTLVDNVTRSTISFLQTEVSSWIKTGEHLNVLISKLAGSQWFDIRRAELIASTEVTRAFAEGNLLAYQASGVVDQKEWMTAQDDIVCPICVELGESKPVALNYLFHSSYLGAISIPPAHPRCRCWIHPVVILKSLVPELALHIVHSYRESVYSGVYPFIQIQELMYEFN